MICDSPTGGGAARGGAFVVAVVVLIAAVACVSSGPRSRKPTISGDGTVVTFPVGGDVLRLDLRDLRVNGAAELSRATATRIGAPSAVRIDDRGAVTWSYPDSGFTFTATARDGRLVVDVTSDRDQNLAWPIAGADATDLQLPLGGGVSIPIHDPTWTKPEVGIVGDHPIQELTMPILGYSYVDTGVSYVVPTDLGSTLTLDSNLVGTVSHTFSKSRGTQNYAVAMAITDGSPTAAARNYRTLLQGQNKFVTLADKIKANPDVQKLIGAFHAYTWAGGREPETVLRLRALGIRRMWLGYDDDGDPPMNSAAVEAAKEAGYLVGPYVSFDNAQDPAGEIDNPGSRWPAGIYPNACVHTAEGKTVNGFQDRGCYLSSQALAQMPDLVRARVRSRTANGANSVFVDVDATGMTFDDYTPGHPMTQAQDRRNRVKRLDEIGKRYVLGSETVGSWATSAVAFSHGSSTPIISALWPLERDKGIWGEYWGEDGPQFFFKQVQLPPVLHDTMFNPKYRIPLYESAFHDSVVSTDRWELPFNKFPAEKRNRALSALLNVAPMMYALNKDTLDREGADLAALQTFYSKLSDTAGTEPLSTFEWLTSDRLVQRTVFGDRKLTVTANFGDVPYADVAPGCVAAEPGGVFCP
ncbi:hypothetical protein BKG80_06465 [Mycobacteroides chelonae]|nr:glycoside hydrolase [Mycobacteroides chelonae]MBF9350252.1 hypothetical protein [Mycobacteroides chelonae]OHU40890.1 hypothetical protein BKG80_06465 [Mycobacteroides chelonae]